MSGRIESGPLSNVDRDDELACDRVRGRGPASAVSPLVSPTPFRPMDKLAGSVLRREGRRVGAERGTSEVANGVISI